MFGQMALQIFLIIKWSGTFPTLVHAVFLFLFSDVGPLQMPEKFLVISSKILGTFVTNQFSLVNLQGMDSQGSFSSKCFGAFITNPSWGWTTIISSQMSSHFNQWSTSKRTNVQISRLHKEFFFGKNLKNYQFWLSFWQKLQKLSCYLTWKSSYFAQIINFCLIFKNDKYWRNTYL